VVIWRSHSREREREQQYKCPETIRSLKYQRYNKEAGMITAE
jgi:hypothetical protein